TKNKRQHIIPITAPMRDILDSRPQRSGRDFIFGRPHDRPFTGWSVCKVALDQRIGPALTDWCHHDIRRSVATRMAELDVAHVIEAVLNHAGYKYGVAGIYNRSTLEPQKRHALTLWAEHLLALVEGRPTPSKVVPLRA